MKHIKKFEHTTKQTKTYPINKFLIHEHSQKYFRNQYKFEVLYVDFAEKAILGNAEYYSLQVDYTIMYDNDNKIHYNDKQRDWTYSYSEKDFNELDFMTAEELYKKHDYLVIDIVERTLENLQNNQNKRSIDFYNKIISMFNIPETEHLINTHKYNL